MLTDREIKTQWLGRGRPLRARGRGRMLLEADGMPPQDERRQVHRPLFQTYLRMRFLGYQSETTIAKETGYSIEHIDGYIRRCAIDAVKINGK